MACRELVSTLLVFSKSDHVSKLVRCILALKKDSIAGDQVVLVVNGGGYSSVRSEERRVGKECRSRWSPYH